MSTDALKQAAGVAIAPVKQPDNFPEMVKLWKGAIKQALPKHMDVDRMARIALTEFRRVPKLAKCAPLSVFAALVMASQLGLEPGVMGQCYLIPFGDECQLIPGYQGLLDLVRRSGRVKRIEAHVVRVGEPFVYRAGLTTILEHEPILEGEPGDLRLAYAVAEMNDGGFHIEVMTRHQIETIRNRSQGYQTALRYGKKSPWDTDTEEMWRKTVVRRICKWLPKSIELATALALEESVDRRGSQGLEVDTAIEANWAPAALEEPEEEATAPVPASEPVKAKKEKAQGQPLTFGAHGDPA